MQSGQIVDLPRFQLVRVPAPRVHFHVDLGNPVGAAGALERVAVVPHGDDVLKYRVEATHRHQILAAALMERASFGPQEHHEAAQRCRWVGMAEMALAARLAGGHHRQHREERETPTRTRTQPDEPLQYMETYVGALRVLLDGLQDLARDGDAFQHDAVVGVVLGHLLVQFDSLNVLRLLNKSVGSPEIRTNVHGHARMVSRRGHPRRRNRYTTWLMRRENDGCAGTRSSASKRTSFIDPPKRSSTSKPTSSTTSPARRCHSRGTDGRAELEDALGLGRQGCDPVGHGREHPPASVAIPHGVGFIRTTTCPPS